MKQILIDKPDGLGYYPFISQAAGGGVIRCLSEAPPFYIENLSDEECTITLSIYYYGSPNPITLDYSYDTLTWTTFTTNGEGTFTIPANSKAYLKGNNSTFSTTDEDFYRFLFGQRCNIGGNLMSLVGDNAIGSYMFNYLFYENANLVSAENLVLPNNVASYCYDCMFSGCTSLVNAPKLPATTLTLYCYSSMFRGCTSLVNAPELPATTLVKSCYRSMFYGCTSLVNAPALPVTTLADYCYSSMFRGCTSLVNAPKLPATTLTHGCYDSMFYGCTALTTAPTLPATTLVKSCYSSMFRGCTSLVNAPELPATTLVEFCYDSMFYGCTNLNYIKAMFTTTPSSTYTGIWLSGVASSGTFVKNASATWDVTGGNGIPSGWTVETAVA